MIIGVPKEIMAGEGRAAATPETVKKLIGDGFDVLVERSAGINSFFSDDQYREAGAELLSSSREVFERADIILKVKEPQFNETLGVHEADMMRPNQYLIAFIHPASPANHEMVKKLAGAGAISLTLDGVPRISRAQSMDALTSMSTCAGYKGMLMAADDLPVFIPPMFTTAGSTKPRDVLIIGAGVAGLQAIATAKRLGAAVRAVDIRPEALEQAKSLGARPEECGVPAEVGVGEGGYAATLSEDWIKREREALRGIIPAMDIVFCSALVPNKKAPVLITEDMVMSMKPGSVIVDISIDQGGNCEITEPGKKCVKHGVVIEGIKNIPGLLPTSSTWMFANNVYNLVHYLAKDGRISLDESDPIVKGIMTTKDGKIVHAGALEAMGL